MAESEEVANVIARSKSALPQHIHDEAMNTLLTRVTYLGLNKTSISILRKRNFMGLSRVLKFTLSSSKSAFIAALRILANHLEIYPGDEWDLDENEDITIDPKAQYKEFLILHSSNADSTCMKRFRQPAKLNVKKNEIFIHFTADVCIGQLLILYNTSIGSVDHIYDINHRAVQFLTQYVSTAIVDAALDCWSNDCFVSIELDNKKSSYRLLELSLENLAISQCLNHTALTYDSEKSYSNTFYPLAVEEYLQNTILEFVQAPEKTIIKCMPFDHKYFILGPVQSSISTSPWPELFAITVIEERQLTPCVVLYSLVASSLSRTDVLYTSDWQYSLDYNLFSEEKLKCQKKPSHMYIRQLRISPNIYLPMDVVNASLGKTSSLLFNLSPPDIGSRQWRVHTAQLKHFQSQYNKSQMAAISTAMRNSGVTVLQGPPGTGKTKTIVGLVSAILYETGSLESIEDPQFHVRRSLNSVIDMEALGIYGCKLFREITDPVNLFTNDKFDSIIIPKLQYNTLITDIDLVCK